MIDTTTIVVEAAPLCKQNEGSVKEADGRDRYLLQAVCDQVSLPCQPKPN